MFFGWEDQLALAVVGTRRATAYGRRQAARFTRELAAAGLVIVSGLARGIDSIAHHEALRSGARTLAVLGSGVGRIYPPETRRGRTLFHIHFTYPATRGSPSASRSGLFSNSKTFLYFCC